MTLTKAEMEKYIHGTFDEAVRVHSRLDAAAQPLHINHLVRLGLEQRAQALCLRNSIHAGPSERDREVVQNMGIEAVPVATRWLLSGDKAITPVHLVTAFCLCGRFDLTLMFTSDSMWTRSYNDPEIARSAARILRPEDLSGFLVQMLKHRFSMKEVASHVVELRNDSVRKPILGMRLAQAMSDPTAPELEAVLFDALYGNLDVVIEPLKAIYHSLVARRSFRATPLGTEMSPP